jgi:hypothetical protein
MNCFCGFLSFFAKTFMFLDEEGSSSRFVFKHLKTMWIQAKYDADIIADIPKQPRDAWFSENDLVHRQGNG